MTPHSAPLHPTNNVKAPMKFRLLLALLFGAAIPSHADTTAKTSTRGDSMGTFLELRDDKTAQDIAALKLGWVRIMYDWVWLEQSQGHYNWTEFDQWIARAKANHLKVLAVAQGSPAWANGGHGPYDPQSGSDTPPLPEHAADFANYAAGMVKHGVDAVEIWNEPNGGFWKPAPDPKAWADLVVKSYDAIKAVNPAIPVVTGGTCPVEGGILSPNSPIHFLQAALAADPELAHKFDGFGFHPYVFADDPTAKDPLTAVYQWNSILQAADIHKILADHGVGDKPFWFTEYGVPTGGPFGAVTPQESATIYAHYYAAFDRLSAQNIPIGPTFFWTMYDNTAAQKANTIEGWEGIYDTTGTPKPSVAIIQSRATEKP